MLGGEIFNSVSVLAPNERKTIKTQSLNIINQADIDRAVDKANPALFVWGVLRYEDVFGSTQKTKFCYWVTGDVLKAALDGASTPGEVSGLHFATYAKFNEYT